MDRQLIEWTIEVRALQTELRAGADPSRPQAAWIDITVKALAPAFPQTIEDCIDYQPICEHVLGAWSEAASRLQPERAVRALADFILGRDGRVGQVEVTLTTGGASWRLTQVPWRRPEARLAA